MKHFTITPLSVNEAEELIGGFSATFESRSPADEEGSSNNCKGGNCKTDCGKNKEIHIPKDSHNKNCKGNCVHGCGRKPH